MATERQRIADRIFLRISVSKGPLGAGLASMDSGSTDCLALQNLQPPDRSKIEPYLKMFPLVLFLTNKGTLIVALMTYQMFQ
eukprot:1139909-Pelagomonas_calceolata.AAC.3